MHKILLMTDPHYLSPALYRDSAVFEASLRYEDGRMTKDLPVILNALEKEIAAEKPDVLVIPGDLTYNGEKQSHLEMAARLKGIRDKGTPICLIPGNHDILNPAARRFTQGGYEPCESITPEAFQSLYAPFMCPPEDTQAQKSYHVRLSDKLCLIMLDICLWGKVPGQFTLGHKSYLEGLLQKARAEGVQPITVSHHSAVPQTAFASDLFAVRGWEELSSLLNANGVRLHLSGHLHTQHIARAGALTDASTGSVSIYPHLIALITLTDEGSLRYEARPLKEEYLPEGFMEKSRRWFLESSRDKNLRALSALLLPQAQKEIMADFSARFNLAFYGGTYQSRDPEWLKEEGYALWKRYPVGIFGQYFNQVIREPNERNRFCLIPKAIP